MNLRNFEIPLRVFFCPGQALIEETAKNVCTVSKMFWRLLQQQVSSKERKNDIIIFLFYKVPLLTKKNNCFNDLLYSGYAYYQLLGSGKLAFTSNFSRMAQCKRSKHNFLRSFLQELCIRRVPELLHRTAEHVPLHAHLVNNVLEQTLYFVQLPA